ncbi:hypothetical protein [Bradyrhizobium canariense]|uniref:hypothetical protein n=1 Tax=Bradyrhizobium canariense TaxID=255045 RepID=UPI001F0A094E|nr:hypothetical protein [Bradyrhizobium canariense]
MANQAGGYGSICQLPFGRLVLLPLLLDIAKAYPALRLVVTFTDRIVDPVEEGVDLSIRFGELRDSGERFAVPGIWQTRDEDGPAPPHRDLEELCPLDRRRVPLAEAAAVRPALPSGAPLGECASEADAAPPRRMRTANLHALPI